MIVRIELLRAYLIEDQHTPVAKKVFEKKGKYITSVATLIQLVDDLDRKGVNLNVLKNLKKINKLKIVEVNKKIFEIALKLKEKYNLNFFDAVVAATAIYLKEKILTLDLTFDKIKEVERLDPLNYIFSEVSNISISPPKLKERIIPLPKSSTRKEKVFIIGLAHFDWKLVRLLLNHHKFKNLRKFFKNSSHGNMIPQQQHCSSPVEFTSIITGVRKEKHSIGYGIGSDKEYIKNGRLITRLDIKTKTIWEIVQKHGFRVGIYHWLLTWPPQKVNGFMLTGRLSQDENKCYPEYLKDLLDERELSVSCPFVAESVIRLIHDFKINLFIGMDESTHGPNHTFWEFIEKKKLEKWEEGKRERFLMMYKWLDDFIKLTKKEFSDATLMIVTDSGMRLADSPVYCTGAETIEIFKKLGIDLQLYAYDLYPPSVPKASPLLYVPNRSPLEKRKISEMLSGIKIKINGEKFIKNIRWSGNYLSFQFNFHPSLVGYNSGNLKLILPNKEEKNLWITKLTGVSFPYGGAFITGGASIHKKAFVKNVETVDITPTVLRLLKIKVPAYMDGKVIEEILI